MTGVADGTVVDTVLALVVATPMVLEASGARETCLPELAGVPKLNPVSGALAVVAGTTDGATDATPTDGAAGAISADGATDAPPKLNVGNGAAVDFVATAVGPPNENPGLLVLVVEGMPRLSFTPLDTAKGADAAGIAETCEAPAPKPNVDWVAGVVRGVPPPMEKPVINV